MRGYLICLAAGFVGAVHAASKFDTAPGKEGSQGTCIEPLQHTTQPATLSCERFVQSLFSLRFFLAFSCLLTSRTYTPYSFAECQGSTITAGDCGELSGDYVASVQGMAGQKFIGVPNQPGTVIDPATGKVDGNIWYG